MEASVAEAEFKKAWALVDRSASASSSGRLEALNRLVELSAHIRDVSLLLPLPTFFSVLREYVVHKTKTARTIALRVLRAYLKPTSAPHYVEDMLYRTSLAYFVARSFENPEGDRPERMQALKLIRRTVEADAWRATLAIASGSGLSFSAPVPTAGSNSPSSPGQPASPTGSLTSALTASLISSATGGATLRSRPTVTATSAAGRPTISAPGWQVKRQSTMLQLLTTGGRRPPLMLPRCIIHALRCVAEAHATDPFARYAMETLSEIAARNTKLVAVCGGIKTLFEGAIEPFFADLQEPLLASILYILDDPAARQYIRPSIDTCTLFSPLSDISTAPPAEEDRTRSWEVSVKAISTMLKSWTGLIALASDTIGLKSLVDALSLPSYDLQNIVLDGLFGIFRMPVPLFTSSSLTKIAGNEEAIENISLDGLYIPSRTYGERPNLMDNYMSALLLAFVDCGLVEALVRLGEMQEDGGSEKTSEQHVARKATVLLAEILHMSSSHLSVTQCARLQTLPSLVSTAVTFKIHDRERVGASHMVANLHHLAHIKSRSSHAPPEGSLSITGANKWRRIPGRDKRLDKVDDIKKKMDYAIDEKQLLVKLQQTQVVEFKDYRKWAWDSISEVLEGPLRNPTHVATAMRQTKFFKRLLSFIRPSQKLFSTLPRSQENLKYALVGCQILEILLATEIGATFLTEECDLLKQLSDMLKEEADLLEQPNTSRSTTRLFDENSILKTMSKEYFALLGTMSSFGNGSDMMRNAKIFVHLKTIVETPGRIDLASLIITSLDYSSAGHARVLFSKALYCPAMVARYFATRHMRMLLRANTPDFSAWGIEYLAKQLADNDPKVWGAALSVLDEACDDPDCMESLIAKKPTLFNLGKAGQDLWLRFLSTENGFNHLMGLDFVLPELERWKTSENLQYGVSLEAALEEAFGGNVSSAARRDIYIPTHLYGELTKTIIGRKLFQDQGIFEELLEDATNTNQMPLRRRAALWAIGNIGSSECGLELLEKSAVIETIVKLAESDTVLSIRGTCFNVIAMLSRTERGRQALEALGWERPNVTKPHVCVPQDLKTCSLFRLPEYLYNGSVAGDETLPCEQDLQLYAPGDAEGNVLTLIGNLANNVLLEKATRQLKRLKSQKSELFMTPQLVLDILILLEQHPFRIAIRRFVYALIPDAVFALPEFWALLPGTTPTDQQPKQRAFPTLRRGTTASK